MPLVSRSEYKASGVFRNPHINTIFPGFFRHVKGVRYARERIATPDGDFLDLDWSRVGGQKLVIALHGLEGSADRPYIRGIVRCFNKNGWDGLGLNFRGCSGEPNRRLRSYHMGETGDLDLVIRHVLQEGRYRQVALVGFSLGGNVILKYLGERGHRVPREITAAVTFSVPCDLPSANREIESLRNRLYLRRFLDSLNAKIEEKSKRFEGAIELKRPLPVSFRDFDEKYTAPIHGFRDALHYWKSASSLQYIPGIEVPTLLINAKDDTFLSKLCYPFELGEKLPRFYLEVPNWGGHVGFYTSPKQPHYWSEKRAFRFVEEKGRKNGTTAFLKRS